VISSLDESEGQGPPVSPRRFGAWRIRRKLMALHTVFSVALAFILLLALRPAIRSVVQDAEEHACRAAIELLVNSESPVPDSLDGMTVQIGAAADVGLNASDASRLRSEGQHSPRGRRIAMRLLQSPQRRRRPALKCSVCTR
jgi:hypothetical protein